MNGGSMELVLRLLGIGWYVGGSIAGGGIGGYLLDRQLGLNPLFTLLGLAAGIAVAVFGMYRMLMAVLSSPTDTE
jgi:F0F1-type ATP synthase assembly protein I